MRSRLLVTACATVVVLCLSSSAAAMAIGPVPGPDTEIGGTVWFDAPHSGILTPDSARVPGVKIILKDTFGNAVATTSTGPDGTYLFKNLDPASNPTSYYVTFDPSSLPSGTTFTVEDAPGATHADDSSADPVTGTTARITLARGTQDLTWNAGIVGPTPGG